MYAAARPRFAPLLLRFCSSNQQSLLLLGRHCHAAAAADAGVELDDGFSSQFGGLSRAFAKKHFAQLLKPDVQEKLRPVFAQLSSYGVENKRIKSLLKDDAPALAAAAAAASSSSDQLQENLKFLKSHGLTDSQIAESVKNHPAILLLSVSSVLQPKVRFFHEQGLSPAAITALLASSPATLSCHISQQLVPRIAYLARQGINKKHLSSCIVKHPPLLTYDVDTRLKPVIKALVATSLSEDIIRQVLLHSPSLLARKPDTITELVSAFKYIGFRDHGRIWAESLAWGSRFGVEAVRDKIDFLMSMDIPYRSVAMLLKAEPHIFKVDNPLLKEKLEFFFQEMKFEVADLIKVPSFLSKKLMDRVKIRWQVLSLLKSKGIIKTIYMQDLVNLPKKWFVETFVFKYPDCGRIYYGGRSAVKQARAQARAASGDSSRYVSYF